MKLILAKTIYHGAMVLAGLALAGCVILMIWGLTSIIPAEVWLIFGGLAVVFAIAIGLGKAWDWANEYLETIDKKAK